MKRLRTIVISLAVVAAAIALAACGSDRSEEDPQKLLGSATLAGVESGEIELSVHAESEGAGGDHLDATLEGPFRQGSGPRGWPELALSAEVKGRVGGRDRDFKGGFTVLSNRAYVDFQGTTYEVDPGTFELAGSSVEKAVVVGTEEGAEDGLGACAQAAKGLELEGLLENLKNEGSAEVDGTSTTKVSGELNIDGASKAVAELAANPACRAQIEAIPSLPLAGIDKAGNRAAGSVENAHVEIYVGDDDIVRKLLAEVAFERKPGSEVVDADIELTLKGVNEDQDISAPAKSVPLVGFYKRLDLFPLPLLETLSGKGGIPRFLEEVARGGLGALSSESGSAAGAGQ